MNWKKVAELVLKYAPQIAQAIIEAKKGKKE